MDPFGTPSWHPLEHMLLYHGLWDAIWYPIHPRNALWACPYGYPWYPHLHTTIWWGLQEVSDTSKTTKYGYFGHIQKPWIWTILACFGHLEIESVVATHGCISRCGPIWDMFWHPSGLYGTPYGSVVAYAIPQDPRNALWAYPCDIHGGEVYHMT